MNQKSGSNPSLKIALFVVAAVIVVAAIVMLRVFPPRDVEEGADDRPIPPIEINEGPRKEMPSQSAEKFFVGVAAIDVQDNQRAIAAFNELTAAVPDEPACWANLALAQLSVNEVEAAREAIAKAVERAPDDDRIARVDARVEERLGNIDKAIAALERLRKKDPASLFFLNQLIERTGREGGDVERLRLVGEILRAHPDNLAARFVQARLAAKLSDQRTLDAALSALEAERATWSEQSAQQFKQAQEHAAQQKWREAATAITFLENLSKPGARYQQSLAALGVSSGASGEPVRAFIRYKSPPAVASDADRNLTFETIAAPDVPQESAWLTAWPIAGQKRALLCALSDETLRIGAKESLPLPGTPAGGIVSQGTMRLADINNDFREDVLVVGSKGLAIYVQQADGFFQAFDPPDQQKALFTEPADGVWTFDVEADGDLDILLVPETGGSRLLQNNGDMTFSRLDTFKQIGAVDQLLWVDFDNDGDVDIAAIERTSGRALLLANERGGRFAQSLFPLGETPVAAIAAGDVDGDFLIDLVALDRSGIIHATAQGASTDDPNRIIWVTREIARWEGAAALRDQTERRRASLHVADVDNNGAADLVASAGNQTAVWLGESGGSLQRLNLSLERFVTSIADVDGDGRLDLAGVTEQGAGSGARVAFNRGKLDYHWQILQPRAVANAGDKRFNSFGLGGRVEVRAGRLVQAAPIQAARVHLGLGTNARMSLARIVWPNGTVQAEYDEQADQVITSQQRLKGSCPFVFTYDGTGLAFVKDFLWRSPLGLRINAQDTAGVTQTEDWIKIPGSLLAARDGYYEVRITAELWETHFIDMLKLMVVDHPRHVDVYVDERFVPRATPVLEVISTTPVAPLVSAHDDRGDDVAELVREIDGKYVDSFALGDFQGIAQEHWIEIELPADLPNKKPVYVIGTGWVYPTDSSLNVAMAQGEFPKPMGFALEARGVDGTWHVLEENLGFPAGKNKTVLIPIPAAAVRSGVRHFRLRTNLEVYWDALAWAAGEAEIPAEKVTTLAPAEAFTRYRGFSELSALDRRKPDIPRYEQLAADFQRWRDLEGYYTRFGDVRPLINGVDDRYIIMNAGDEIVLLFRVPPGPDKDHVRDFVLIGDGWVKDGDYNTTFSRTVLPLPSHGDADYTRAPGSLFDDPVYRRHSEDWQRFHTRWVSPARFARGLSGKGP